MRPLLRPALLVFLAALAARLTAQPANVQADPTTGALFRPSAATFISGNNLASATGGIVLGANGGTGVANTGKTLTLGGNVTTSGAFGLTLTLTAASAVTLPTTGTLATLAGSETLTNKTLTSPTLTTPTLGAATATSLTLSGNISSSAWTTSGVRLKGVAATLTDTTSTGTVTAAYTDVLGGNTIAASSATTFTDYITAFFKEPTAGSLVTMTNKWALGGESLRVGTSTPMTVSTAGAITANSLTARASTNLTLTSGLVGTNRVNIPDTLSATSSISGALTIGNGTAATNVAIGGGAIVAGGGITSNGGSAIGVNGFLSGNYYRLIENQADSTNGGGIIQTLLAGTWTNTLTMTHTGNATLRNAFTVSGSAASTGVGSGALQVAGGIYAGAASVFAADTTLGTSTVFANYSGGSGNPVLNVSTNNTAAASIIQLSNTGAGGTATQIRYEGNTSATANQLLFYINGAAALSMAKTTLTATFGGVVIKKNYTVATLPAAASYTYGEAYVSDATQAAGTSLGSAPTGGGSVKRGVYSDGSSWLLR